MNGINKDTGKPLSGIAHLQQSIEDILTTLLGSRLMLRDYGSKLFELIDQPKTEPLKIELIAATAEALQHWEPRYQLQSVDVMFEQQGKVTLHLTGLYLPTNQAIPLTIHL